VAISLMLKLVLSSRLEWKLGLVISSNERVAESLQRGQSIIWINLQDLLNKVYELEYLESLLDSISQGYFVQAVNLDAFSLKGFCMLHSQLLDVPLLEKLTEVEERMVSLRPVYALLHVIGHRCHQELLERLQAVLLGELVKREESVSIDRVVNHLG
jgi:hypothetical protein